MNGSTAHERRTRRGNGFARSGRLYPPNLGVITLSARGRRAELAGMALYGPCRRRTVAAHFACWAIAAVTGTQVLPLRRAPALPDIVDWAELYAAWEASLGHFDGLAWYRRRQRSRSGLLVLLLRRGRAVATVKVRDEAGPLEVEARALETVSRHSPGSFAVCEPLAAGTAGSHHWLALAPMPSWPHRPAWRAPVRHIVEELQSALANSSRPPNTPDHWLPVHGDLAPWNLRRLGKAVWLLDWEQSGWGPPEADAAYFRAAAAALGRGVSSVPDDETRAYWEERIRIMAHVDEDAWLNEALLRALCPPGGETVTTLQQENGRT